ncbi:DNA glycosylase AlkZ-like family protein [Nonomuraea sp. NPDC049480]|uniref:DNA glycosylase AlkZ-like family protein n=1 Tax=Nonomuraea sp. NPDC049480 TaxID=3364353 RepID=UPI00378AF290
MGLQAQPPHTWHAGLWTRLTECRPRGCRGAVHRAALDTDEVVAAGRELLDERPCTPGELGRLPAQRWPDRDPASLAYAVRNLPPVVQAPPRGMWGAGLSPAELRAARTGSPSGVPRRLHGGDLDVRHGAGRGDADRAPRSRRCPRPTATR